MRISVAICTWNRAPLLRTTLQRLIEAAPPRLCDWEVVVVDNNSSDGTAAIVKQFAAVLPVKYTFEPQQGLAHARNAAVRVASGDYIIWTDDDVLVDEDWLVSYERAFLDHPESAFFGGPIRPWFEGDPPKWLVAVMPQVEGAFAMRDLGTSPFRIDDFRVLPYGANYAVRAEEQRKFSYKTSLGRVENGGGLGEESDVLKRILEAGGTGTWVPEATVRHWIPSSRQTLSYLRSYYTLLGVTEALESPKTESVRTIAGLPRWAIRVLIEETVKYYWRVVRRDDRWILSLIDQSRARGRLRSPRI